MFENDFNQIQAASRPAVFEKYPALYSEEMHFAYDQIDNHISFEYYMEQLRFGISPYLLNRIDLWLREIKLHSKDYFSPYSEIVFAIFRAAIHNSAYREQSQEESRLSRAFVDLSLKFIHDFYITEEQIDTWHFDEFKLPENKFVDLFIKVALFYGTYPGLAYQGVISCFRKVKQMRREEDVRNLFYDLFVQYPVPKSILYNFDVLDKNEILLLAQLLRGKSLREYAFIINLPVHKKDVHYFMHTESDQLIKFKDNVFLRLIIYAKLIRFSENHHLFYRIMNFSKMFSENPLKFYEDLSFWKSFVILQNQTENADGNGLWLDLRSLIDYVEYMRYQETDRTFSLRGRTFISLIRLMNEWHEEQDFASLEKYLESEWSIFYKVELEEYNKDNEIYKIEELNTGRKLSEEGKALKHCVFSYIEDCMKHSSIILGLRKKVNEGFVPWVSFETNGGFILQAYGYKNRDITENEKEIITEWAKMNDVVWEL